MVLKVCLQCGEEFEAKRSDAKFCSPKCRQRAKRSKQSHDPKVCLCGKEFVPNHGNQEYCSDDCAEWAKDLDRSYSNYVKARRTSVYDDDEDFIDYVDYE